MKHLPLSHLHNKLDGKSAKNKKRKTLKCASKSAFYWSLYAIYVYVSSRLGTNYQYQYTR